MQVNLPDDLASRVRAEVHMGQFASVEEAVAEAVRRLLRSHPTSPTRLRQEQTCPRADRDDAELLERITESIMQGRRSRTLRLPTHA